MMKWIEVIKAEMTPPGDDSRTLKQIAEELGLSESYTYRKLRRAVEAGQLEVRRYKGKDYYRDKD